MRFWKHHKMNDLHGKTDVRDLNCAGASASLFGHEHRPICPFADSRPRALADAYTPCKSLRCGVSRSSFWVSPTTHLHGIRPTDMARRSAGYCRLPQCASQHEIPFGFSRADCKVHFGRCQRGARLAALAALLLGLSAPPLPLPRWPARSASR
mgnify:CR=1 FL=1